MTDSTRKVVNLDDYRGCELLGTVSIYKQSNGEILLCPIHMDEAQIESVDTISERFELIADWLVCGVGSLHDQADDFREPSQL